MASLFFLLGALGGADLEDLAKRSAFAWSADGTGRHTIHADGLTLVFAPGLQTALVNGASTRLSWPVTIEGGRVRVPPELARLIERNPVAAPPPLTKSPSLPTKPKPAYRLPPFKVVIDPGHGGAHKGFVGRAGIMEKDINLDVSLELRNILESWGVTVVMTREKDRHFAPQVDDDLDCRVEIVNRAKPDLFLSIHTNGVDNPGPRGYEVFVPKHATGAREASSREISAFVRSELGDVWRSDDRGTKDDRNLRVLNGTRCPGALIELEFVSNPTVERQLARSDVRRRLAESIAEAVKKWALRRK